MNKKINRRKVSKSFDGVESMTRQSERYLTDINRIKTQGILPPDPNQLVFADVSDEFDFSSAQNEIIRINNSFASLPSHIRKRFENNPGKLMEFMRNSDNIEEARELGIIPPEPRKPNESSKSSSDAPASSKVELPSGGSTDSSQEAKA